MATEKLPVMLTQDERNQKARNVTALLKKYREIEARAKSAAAEYKEELKDLRAEIDRESEAVHGGYEDREVELKSVENLDAFTVEVFRVDTEEKVRTRNMTEDEMRAARQQKLPLRDSNVTPLANVRDRNKVPEKKEN